MGREIRSPTCDARVVREKPPFEGEATRAQRAGGRRDQREQKHVAYLIHRRFFVSVAALQAKQQL